MDQNENVKSGSEPLRVCKICGGPNHYGCGCEAKAAAAATAAGLSESEAAGLLESETPAESETDEDLENILSAEGIIAEHEAFKKMAQDIRVMSEGQETVCVCLYDANNLLKIIAGDLITIRKFLTKEDEVKNADADKDKN